MKVLHIGWGFIPWRGGGLIEYTEDLMHAQVSLGYDVAYFFSGRHYPLFRRPFLKKWRKDGVRMYELINCPVLHAGHLGTRNPDQDLNEQSSERTFENVLDKWQPDLIHIQELAGFPSSLIEIAKSRDLPVIMTLEDYFLLCPTLKLFDYKREICSSKEVGDKCIICCANAPAGLGHSIRPILRYEATRLLKLGPGANNWITKMKNLVRSGRHLSKSGSAESTVTSDPLPLAGLEEAFQHRRDVNVSRLNMVDLLIGQSRRVTEIYCKLGIQPERARTVHTTLEHLGTIQPKLLADRREPISFATMNGCASVEKGAKLILGALHRLQEWGLSTKFRLIIMGSIDPDFRQDFLSLANVVCSGYYDRNHLNHLLEPVDVGIVPSIWEEAYGYVGVEFLAKGIPVIGNRMGGIADYVLPGETGWLNEDNSAEGLANVMASLIRNPEQISAMNRNVVASHDRIIKAMDAHVAEIDTIYKQVLGNERSSSGAETGLK